MLGLVAAMREFETTALDLSSPEWPYDHPHLSFVKQDILDCTLPEAKFDLIINCSAVEHVGLAGRYYATATRPDGDLEAMRIMHRLLKPDGRMILTVPVGKDQIFAPYCRVYGQNRLPALLDGYHIEEEAFWLKDAANQWVSCTKDSALDFGADAGSGSALRDVYALGCFVLKLEPLRDTNR
jgi:SAM-dependent methyltransferase